jgi:hypothetical protein
MQSGSDEKGKRRRHYDPHDEGIGPDFLENGIFHGCGPPFLNNVKSLDTVYYISMKEKELTTELNGGNTELYGGREGKSSTAIAINTEDKPERVPYNFNTAS